MHNFRINVIQRLFHLLLIIPMGLGVGCEDPEGPTDIMPLAVGNYWEYETKRYFKTDPQVSEVDTVTSLVLDKMIVDFQGEAFEAFVLNEYSAAPYNWLLSNEPDGLYLLGGKNLDGVTLHKSQMIQYPYYVNSVWSDSSVYLVWDNKISENVIFVAGELFETKCVGIDVLITSSLGKFECAVFRYKRRASYDIANEYDFYDYYAPGVGLVRRKIYDEGFLFLQKDLLNFHLE